MKLWKKQIVGIVMIVAVLLGAVAMKKNTDLEKEQEEGIKIGVSIYSADDTYIKNIMTEFEMLSKDYEKRYNKKINLNIVSAKSNQNLQNRQIERFVDLGYDAICVNPVDRTNVSLMVDQTAIADIPLIFFNREPVEDDLFRRDNIYYVGSDARESAQFQGEMINDAYEKSPEIFDLNGNGILEYAMLEGETGHQDAIIRSEWAIKSLEAKNIKLERVTSGVANWRKDQGAALTEKWLKEYPEQLELIISNNDDMALGAIEALEKSGNKGIQVVGIDGTEEGRLAVEKKKMLGTVGADIEQYAQTLLKLSVGLVENGRVDESLELDHGKFIWINWKKYAQE